MLALAGCATTGSPAASTNVTGSTAPSATQAATSQAPAASSAPTTSKPAVDLTFTGVSSFVAKGTAGQCTLGKDAAGNVVNFGFGATQADYPGLGDGFYVSEGPAGFLTIKWLASAGVGYLNFGDIVNAISADHHSVTLDADIKGSPGTEHVAGTIVCP